MSELLTLNAAAALVMLTIMEIVLGIDNVVFIAILTGKLEERQRAMARRFGLGLAMVARIGLLFVASWLISLEHARVFSAMGEPVSAKDLVLIAGGAFLIYKGTHEIHKNLEGSSYEEDASGRASASFASVIGQIVVMDMVFSVDSVITAVGMTRHLPIMIAAMMIAIGVMMVFAGPTSRFVERHPTTKMLALAFLILIGVMLAAEGLGQELGRGYVYAAMGFSIAVEALNLRATAARQRRRREAGSGAETG